jgi:ethanolaminephosphotransferase
MAHGNVPNFLDYFANLDDSVSTHDSNNWVSRFKEKGKKIIFYGDDTWLKLFPNSFERYEGTTSFFVSVCLVHV